MKKQKIKIDFKYFIFGILLLMVGGFIHGPIEDYSRDNIYNPSLLFVLMGIAIIYVSMRNTIYSWAKKDILEDTDFTWNVVIIITAVPL